MRGPLNRRPSASLIVAMVALVVALSGTAVAASRLVSGDSIIRKGTLSGNRLRRHTLTGVQVDVKRLGTVPRAAQASQATRAAQATSAGYAVNATNATDAAVATNALQLGGRAASGYLTTDSRIGTGGTIVVAGTGTGATRTLLAAGPFTVTMTCTASGGSTGLTIEATSSEANSDLDGTLAPTAGASTALSLVSRSPTSGFARNEGLTVSLQAPSGAGAVVSGADGVNWPADGDCFADFAGLS